MGAKDMFLDFLNIVFSVLIIIFAIFFFVLWGYFDSFTELLKNIAPLAVFGSGLIIALKINGKKYKKRESEGNLDIVLRLTYMDKIKMDLITFGLPLILCAIPLIMHGSVSLINIFQAMIAFLTMILFKQSLFSKEQ
jgi:hypothetical protein